HDPRCLYKMKIVEIRPAAESVGTLKKFIANAYAPPRSVANDIRDHAYMKVFRILSPNHHRKRVFKTKRLADFEVEALSVELFHSLIDRIRKAVHGSGAGPVHWLVQYSSKSGPRVFDVKIDLSREQRFVHQKRASQIRFALNRHSRTRLDVLRQEFRKDDLLGEELRPDHDPVSLLAGENQTNHA